MNQRATGTFLVRVWIEPPGPAPLTGAIKKRFRGEVKDLKTGDATLVADPQALVDCITESLRFEGISELISVGSDADAKRVGTVAQLRR